MTEKRLSFKQKFLPLFVTQFFGAFNDNLFKSALLLFVAFRYPEQSPLYTNIIAGLFILPFFLFSAASGNIAAKYNRRKLAIVLKCTELILMLLASGVFYSKSLVALALLLFLMGTQSTLFGPVKYALLPQLLNKEELIKGNAFTEGGTYFSIIIGSVLGAMLPFYISLIILISMAVIGLISAILIIDAPAPNPQQKLSLNIIKDTKNTIALLKKNNIIWRTIWGITWFWMVGAFALTQIFPLAAATLNTTPLVVSFFLLLFSLGVGIGSFLSYKILKNQITLFYVPLASFLITLTGFLIFVATITAVPAQEPLTLSAFMMSFRGIFLALLFLTMAIAGGIYVVPLNVLLQKTAPATKLAQIIAGNNILNSLGMVLVAIGSAILAALGCNVPVLFLIMSIINLIFAFYIAHLFPKELIRSIFRILLKILYRVKTEGFENMQKAPRKSLVISNHTSLLDGLLIAAFLPRPVCFAINTDWTKHPFIRLFSKVIDFYPIDAGNPLSVRNLIGELNKGRTIMMFPEGRISVTGNLMKVYDGAGLIAEAAHAKIIPLRIDGADLSKFSYLNGLIKTRLFPKIRMQMLPAIDLPILETCSHLSRRQHIASSLFLVMKNMMATTEKPADNPYLALKNAAIRYGNKPIIEDSARKVFTYQQFIKQINKTAKSLKHAKDDKKAFVITENNIVAAAHLFALFKCHITPILPDGSALDIKHLYQNFIDTYYTHGSNARDTFFSELLFDNPQNIALGLFLPLLTGAKLFLNNGRKGANDLVYDTDSTILCLKDKESLHRLQKSASRLDFYALRKVWLLESAQATKEEKSLWLTQFGIKLKNL